MSKYDSVKAFIEEEIRFRERYKIDYPARTPHDVGYDDGYIEGLEKVIEIIENLETE